MKGVLIGIWVMLLGIGMQAQSSNQDTIAPKVYCLNGLAINLDAQQKVVTIRANEINVGSSDNKSITKLLLSLHAAEANQPDFSAKESLTFGKVNTGKHKIDLWAGDEAGNWSRNSTYILVNDLTQTISERNVKLNLQNSPNPFSDDTTISFFKEKAEKAALNIYDLMGKNVYKKQLTTIKGQNKILVRKDDLPKAGHYYYQLKTGDEVILKNMIMVNY